nr:hypothetical protein CFP56_11158 [Quercus suber]
MAGSDLQSAATTGTVYHCLCSQMLLYLPPALLLSTLPKRVVDGSHICPLVQSIEHNNGKAGILLDSVQDSNTVVVKFEDGFEKRYLLECARCGITMGWFLDGRYGEGGLALTRQLKDADVVLLVSLRLILALFIPCKFRYHGWTLTKYAFVTADNKHLVGFSEVQTCRQAGCKPYGKLYLNEVLYPQQQDHMAENPLSQDRRLTWGVLS